VRGATQAGSWNATVEEKERSRDNALRHEEDRRLSKLEGKQQRREFKRRSSSRADQLSLFRW